MSESILGPYSAERLREAIEFARGVQEDLRSSSPDSAGTRIRKEIIESTETAQLVFDLVTQQQLFGQQINRFGQPMPLYKPDTLKRKLRKFPGWTATRYTYLETGNFYKNGLYIYVDEAEDVWYITKVNAGYFAYLDDDAVGLTPDNAALVKAYLDRRVREAFLRYFREEIESSGYAMYYSQIFATLNQHA